MTTKLIEWACVHRQPTKIELSGRLRRKTLSTAVQSGYGRSGIEGYLRNIGYNLLMVVLGNVELLSERLAGDAKKQKSASSAQQADVDYETVPKDRFGALRR